MAGETAIRDYDDDTQFAGSFGFDDFFPLEQRKIDVLTLGASAPLNRGGVLLEQAAAFDFSLTEPLTEATLKALIGRLGASKYLADNLPQVRERLGDHPDAAHLPWEWASRLHMGRPVKRSFMSSEQPVTPGHDVVAVTGAVPNWMWARAQEVRRQADEGLVDRDKPVILAAGTGRATGKNPADPDGEEDLPEDATQAEFMKWVVRPALRKAGFSRVELLPVSSREGRDVALALVQKVASMTALAGARVLLVSNPSAWVEGADQVRRMARENERRGFDSRGQQLDVVTYGIKIGQTGDPAVENPRDYQNPLTAIGLAGRAYRSLFLHTPDF